MWKTKKDIPKICISVLFLTHRKSDFKNCTENSCKIKPKKRKCYNLLLFNHRKREENIKKKSNVDAGEWF